MKHLVPAAVMTVILPAFLTGCGSASETPQPGQYQQVTEITELEFPGMTDAQRAEMKEQMEQAAGGGTSGMFCMKGEDSAQWKNASQQMAQSLGGTCKTEKDSGSDTTLDLKMSCTGTASGDIDIVMTGSANSEGYSSDMAFDISNSENDQTARIAMTMSAERIGDCGQPE